MSIERIGASIAKFVNYRLPPNFRRGEANRNRRAALDLRGFAIRARPARSPSGNRTAGVRG